MKIEIEADLVQAVLDYLSSQPYGQVSNLIQAIVTEANAQKRNQNGGVMVAAPVADGAPQPTANE